MGKRGTRGKAKVTQGSGRKGPEPSPRSLLLSTCPASVPLPPPAESAMERDRYMSPMEAQEFGILDKVLVHPPQDGEDEPELVQKEPVVTAAATAEPAPAST